MAATAFMPELCTECFTQPIPREYPPARVAVGWALLVCLVLVSATSTFLVLRYRRYSPLKHRNGPLLVLQLLGTMAGGIGITRELVGEYRFPCIGAPLYLACMWGAFLGPWTLRLFRAALLARTHRLLREKKRNLALEKTHQLTLWMLRTGGLLSCIAVMWATAALYVIVQLLVSPRYSQLSRVGCHLSDTGDLLFMYGVGTVVLGWGFIGTLYVFCLVKDPTYFRTEVCALGPALALALVLKGALSLGAEVDKLDDEGRVSLLSSRWLDALFGIFVCVVVGIVPSVMARRGSNQVTAISDRDLAADFARVLATKNGQQEFVNHLERELSSENWKFYVEADLSDHKLSNEDITEHVKQIFANFVRPGAPMQVNLPEDLREALTTVVAGGPPYSRTLFEAARVEVYNLMERDAFRRFTYTAPYRRLKNTISFRVLTQAPDLVSASSSMAQLNMANFAHHITPKALLGRSFRLKKKAEQDAANRPETVPEGDNTQLTRLSRHDALGQGGDSMVGLQPTDSDLGTVPSFTTADGNLVTPLQADLAGSKSTADTFESRKLYNSLGGDMAAVMAHSRHGSMDSRSNVRVVQGSSLGLSAAGGRLSQVCVEGQLPGSSNLVAVASASRPNLLARPSERELKLHPETGQAFEQSYRGVKLESGLQRGSIASLPPSVRDSLAEEHPHLDRRWSNASSSAKRLPPIARRRESNLSIDSPGRLDGPSKRSPSGRRRSSSKRTPSRKRSPVNKRSPSSMRSSGSGHSRSEQVPLAQTSQTSLTKLVDLGEAEELLSPSAGFLESPTNRDSGQAQSTRALSLGGHDASSGDLLPDSGREIQRPHELL